MTVAFNVPFPVAAITVWCEHCYADGHHIEMERRMVWENQLGVEGPYISILVQFVCPRCGNEVRLDFAAGDGSTYEPMV